MTPVTQAPPLMTPPTVVVPTEPGVTTLANGPSAPDQGGSIDAISRRRNIIRSHTEAVVNDSIAQAQRDTAQGAFDAAGRARRRCPAHCE